MSERSTSPFTRVRVDKKQEIDIEALFYDLKNRDPKIRDLYAHQADILREYYKTHITSQDVGIELPTGSGKTLVGLLIGEWRRRSLGQRILYLCPTRQLAYQVNEQSKDYDIDSRLFVGSKKAYDRQNLMLYRSAQTIAISTYSGLFNVSPGIDDPQTIILDDAHGAETYIGSMWSLNITRIEHSDLYSKIIELFGRDLPSHFIGVINRGNRNYITHTVEKVPFGAFLRSLQALYSILDSDINGDDDLDLYFRWHTIRDGLHACHVYISYNSILIRPYIPPTLVHKPFLDTEQRIYMSASLGRGGELERITGIREILRIPTPKTYETRGIGRRLYIFPDFSQYPNEYKKWIAHRLSTTDRTLVLCPTRYKARQFLNILGACSKRPSVLGARDIEETLEPFANSDHSVLLLTNRYDGIDLPDGICRQMIIDGIPSGTNLQENFLEERLGLYILLRERIKTRIQQASGRCTRSDTDIAAIIMLDRKLLDFCARVENQKIFHQEIRAEILFAFEQHKNPSLNVDSMLESFMSKDENWDLAEQDISNLSRSVDPPDASVTGMLDNIVKYEVDFSYAMWAGDYEHAVKCARNVADNLSGKKLSPYRALWYYYVATAAYAQSKDNSDFKRIAENYLIRAKSASQTVSWFPNALRSMLLEPSALQDISETQALAVEGIVENIRNMGTVGIRFAKRLEDIDKNLNETGANVFDQGLMQLGTLLGFNSYIPIGDATPDVVWHLENHLLFLFEGKSDEAPEAGISVKNCRQTSGHLDWVKMDPNLKDIATKYCVLVSPRTSIDEIALPHGEQICYLHTLEALHLFERTKQMLVELRSAMIDENSDNYRETVLRCMDRYNLTPEKIIEMITSKPVTELPRARAGAEEVSGRFTVS